MGITNVLRKLLPPDEKIFFELFEDNMNLAAEAANHLKDMLETGFSAYKLEQARNYKARSEATLSKTLTHLSSTFITPIDREDIQSLALLINKITQKTVKVIKYAKVYRMNEFNSYLKESAEILVKVTKELNVAISALKKFNGPQKHTEISKALRDLENQCDFLLFEAIEELFNGDHDSLEVVKYRSLYRDIESVMETTHNLSNLILNIVLKHS